MNPNRMLLSALVISSLSFITTIAKAQVASLPSQRYDDYDHEKYADILTKLVDAENRARYDYQQADQRFDRARHREQEVGRAYNQLVDRFKGLQGQVDEINRKIKQDNDQQVQLKKQIDQLNTDLKSLQDQVTQNTASQARLKDIADALKADLDKQQTNVTDLTNKSKAAKDASDKAQKAVTDQEALIEAAKAELAKATTDADKAAAQAKIDAALAQMPTLLTNRTSAKTASDAVLASLTAAQATLKTAQDRSDAAKLELTNAQNNGKTLTQARDKKQSDLTTATKQQDNLSADLKQLNQNLINSQNQIESTKRDLERADRDLRMAQGETRQSGYERDAANGVLTSKMRDRQTGETYLRWVDDNINKAHDLVSAQAQRDGGADGDREGREIGSERGSRDGNAVGTKNGTQDGTVAGQQRDYAIGKQQGIDLANQNATNKATQDAEVTGKREGEAKGTKDGLAASYQKGKQEGLQHGDATGDDKVAYQKGRDKGETDGLANAIRDAAYREAEGYTDKENYYLGLPLKSVVIGNQNLAEKFKGLQGRQSEDGDDRYYHPHPDQFPHPRITKFYMDTYDSSYRAMVGSTYRQVYDQTYKDRYAVMYKQSYDGAFAQKYEDSRIAGYNDGYKATYQNAYDRVYAIEYKIRYDRYYQIQFDNNKNDKTQHDLGFRDGNAIASEKKGYREGQQFAYDKNIEIEKQKAYNKGVGRADDLYTKNAVIRMTGIELRENDADGIFRPGEGLVAVIKLKNFGLVGKSDLVSEVSSLNENLTLGIAKAPIAQIPGQSDATILAPVQITINADAEEGSVLSFKETLTDSKGKVADQNFSKSIMFPVKVSIAGFDGILIPGVKTSLKFVLENRSQVAQNLDLALGLDATKIQSDKVQAQVVGLAAGSRGEVVFNLIGKPEAQFEETALDLSVTQNNVVFAADANMNVTIIRRHETKADSKGLILSANLAKGGGKNLFAASKLDTWDLRVDGSVDNVAKLSDYSGKVVHIMADDRANFDSATMQSVVELIRSKNGSIVVWGHGLDQSSVAQQLQQIIGISNVKVVNLNDNVVGKANLEGVQLTLNTQVSLLQLSGAKARTVLQSQLGSIGVSSFANGLAEQVGQIFTFGVSSSDLSADQIRALLTAVDNAKLGFAQKLDLATKNPQASMKLAVIDVLNEMIQAELNNSGSWYSDNKKNSKLYRAIKKVISDFDKKSAVRVEFTKLYAAAYDVLQTMKNTNEKSRVEQIMNNERFGGMFSGRTWKDDFCSNNQAHKACQSAPGPFPH